MENSSSQILEETTLPIISAPMFLVSSPKFVIEACKSGIIGSFPLLNARSPQILEEWMQQIIEEINEKKRNESNKKIAPWAVNLIVHQTNTRYETDLELIKKYQPPIVITSLGNPHTVVNIVHEYGGIVMADVSTIKHAKKASQTGVDGLILVCNGAGGHAGTINPFAFINSVKRFWNGIIILAGCISNGADIVAAKVMGADFVYMGTRFIATTESFAPKEYQNMLIEASLENLIYTDAFSGVKANFLIPSIIKAGLDPQTLKKKEKIDFSGMAQQKIKAWKDIWSAGQGVDTINQISTIAEVVKQLKVEYEEALAAFPYKQ